MTEAQKLAARAARAAAKAAGVVAPKKVLAPAAKAATKPKAKKFGVPRAPNAKAQAEPTVTAEQVKTTDADAAVTAHQGEDEGNLDGDKRSPLEYMLAVMNNPLADAGRRDRMAVAAAVYLHKKQGESGKKLIQQVAAKTAGAGKFAASAPPRLVSNRP
jgi:phage terminase small subunit